MTELYAVFSQELQALNQSVVAAGLPPVYFIGQVFSAGQMDEVKFPVDAFSTYGLASAGTVGGEPFSAHAAREASLWDSMASKGTVVPTFTPFWDQRPQDAGCCKVNVTERRPCPWCGECGTGAVANETECALGGSHSQLPGPGEAAAQMKKMLEWIGNNNRSAEAGLGLISAWCVLPTYARGADTDTCPFFARTKQRQMQLY